MRLKFGLLLSGGLLVCLSACASNNNPSPQTNSVSTVTNTQTSQTAAVQPTAGSANEAGAVPGVSPRAANETTAAASGIDACSLITGKEIEKIQGGAIKETKSSQRGEGEFLMSQCFYTAQEFVRSVSLTLIQPHPSHPDKEPRQYFTEKFREAGKKPEAEREKEREREKARERKGEKETSREGERGEEEEEEASVERVGGLGDGAYWVKSGPSASLYVLKKNQFLILSIGGGDAEPIKLRKTKALAQQALTRLK